MLLKAGDVLGRLGDKDTGLQDDGSQREPGSCLLFFASPSYSDISLSDVGSHFTFLAESVAFFAGGCVLGVGDLVLSW